MTNYFRVDFLVYRSIRLDDQNFQNDFPVYRSIRSDDETFKFTLKCIHGYVRMTKIFYVEFTVYRSIRLDEQNFLR